MKLTFKLDGLKEFEKSVKSYEIRKKNQIKDLVSETITNAESFAISKTPTGKVNGGNLKSSWFVNYFNAGLTGELSNSAEYAYWVEYGTSPHTIRPKNSRLLVFEGDNGMVFTRQVNHPGTKAQPMLSPAMQKAEAFYYTRLARILGSD